MTRQQQQILREIKKTEERINRLENEFSQGGSHQDGIRRDTIKDLKSHIARIKPLLNK